MNSIRIFVVSSIAEFDSPLLSEEEMSKGRVTLFRGAIIIALGRARYRWDTVPGELFLLPNGTIGICQNVEWLMHERIVRVHNDKE